MSQLELVDVTKQFGTEEPAVAGLSLSVDSGEAIVLLGPSGCGKTTTLRMIAGFDRPSSGRIAIDGRDVAAPGTFVPPEKRNVNVVFQNYALWPHLTVNDNVGFGPSVRKVRRSEIGTQVDDALRMVQLTGYGDRYPHELSGGQQQRVALARALVNRPQVLLLDEPLSNLDTALREEMRSEIRLLRDELGFTMIYVTHDRAEALALADRVVVLNRGSAEQVGPPERMYARPLTSYAANALGDLNLVPGRLHGAHGGQLLRVRLENGSELLAGAADEGRVTTAPEAPVMLAVRSDDFELVPVENAPLVGDVLERTFLGEIDQYRIRLALLDTAVKVTDRSRSRLEVGSRIGLDVPDGRATVLRDVDAVPAAPESDDTPDSDAAHAPRAFLAPL